MRRCDGAGVRQGCIGASEPDHLGRPILKVLRNGQVCRLHRKHVRRAHMCLQQCVVKFNNRNTEGCRRLRGSTRRRKTICSGAEDRSTGAQHRTENKHTKTYRPQNSFNLTTQHAGSLWGDRCRIRVDCIGFTRNGRRFIVSRRQFSKTDDGSDVGIRNRRRRIR